MQLEESQFVPLLIQYASSTNSEHHQTFIDFLNGFRSQITLPWYLVLTVSLKKMHADGIVPDRVMYNLEAFAPVFPYILQNQTIPDIDLCVRLPSKH